ncbi:MAG: nucleotidyltransferase family protein [Bariatricus sp.]|nr:nucleotidyltransferase family protein [Bariatricus sp.]
MKVKLIYLAAGNSRRFGKGNKLLCPVNGKPMYLHLLERLVQIEKRHPKWEVLVVTQYQEIIEGARSLGARAVLSPNSYLGASWSVKAAIELAKEADACVFFAADQPYLTEKTAEEFLCRMEAFGEGGLGCVCFKETTGNPVWFSKKYFPELLSLAGDRGGKKVLKAHLEEASFFQVASEKELVDVDIWNEELEKKES